jgi:saccharopine dehydrogenase-like NADP-dependent oxidoreductase
MVEQTKYKVLLIGSGLMTPPLVEYLVSFNDTKITVASNIIKDAEKIAKRHPQCMSAIFLDVMDVSKVNSNFIAGDGSGTPS